MQKLLALKNEAYPSQNTYEFLKIQIKLDEVFFKTETIHLACQRKQNIMLYYVLST